MQILEWERKVVEALLAGDDPILETLRNQWAGAEVSARKYTGVGFFVDFIVSPTAKRVALPDFNLTDIMLFVKGAVFGALVILSVQSGVIKLLEVCTHDEENFPEHPEAVSIRYFNRKPGTSNELVLSDKRDLEFPRNNWTP